MNKIKIRGAVKCLVQWKGFTTENNTQKKEDLENTKKVVVEFKKKISIEVRR